MSATLGKVAKHAGVAIDTARKALRGDPTVRPYIKTAVLKSAKALDYQPNLVARALRGKSLNLVPISVHQLNEFFFGDLAAHISKSLVQIGMEPALCFNPEHLLRLSRSFSTSASVIVAACKADLLYELSERQKIVTIDSNIPTIKGVGNVGIDFVTAYRGLTRRVLGMGRTKIAIVSAHHLRCLREGWHSQKFPHVFDELGDAGLDAVGPTQRHAFASTVDLGAWIDANPGSVEAVLCENDLAAAKVVAMLAKRKLGTPEDILVAGCDANCRVEGTWSVRLDTESLAEEAVRLLSRLLDGEDVTENPVYLPEIIDENGNAVPID